jgi:hypothetical protein
MPHDHLLAKTVLRLIPAGTSAGGNPSHRRKDGTRAKGRAYRPPTLANPGNVIDCGAVGGGNIGSSLAHENEAPFPEFLAESFIRPFCPPNSTVLDPFDGSGTTAVVAARLGRNAITIDCRPSQADIVRRRAAEAIALRNRSGDR